MTLGFIVRATLEGGVWVWSLHDLADGRRQRFGSFDELCAALQALADDRRPAARRAVELADVERS